MQSSARQDLLFSLKNSVHRVKHSFEGQGTPDSVESACVKAEPPPLAFKVFEINLYPVFKPAYRCVPCIPFEELSSVTILIRRVVDVSQLHLHLKTDRTQCELWSNVWSTSRVLSEMLASDPVRKCLIGARVIEIGAGAALCGLTAATQGAFVTVTDSSEMSLHLASNSAELNGLSTQINTFRVDWHSDVLLHPEYELLIGSDVLFLRANSEAVLRIVEKSVLPGGLAVLLCPGRPSSIDFEAAVETHSGLSVEIFEKKDLAVSDTSLLKLTRLFLITVGPLPSSRTIELKIAFAEAWGWLTLRSCNASAQYEYIEKL